MAESKQQWVGRNRPPRVQITYDVQIGNAIETKQLPLVMGVVADLSGGNTPALKLKDRKFIEIDRDNFDEVFTSIAPTVKVASVAEPIQFTSLDDFNPAALAARVEGVKQMLQLRNLLTDLAAKLDGNVELDDALLALAGDKTQQKLLAGAYVEEPSATDLTTTGGN